MMPVNILNNIKDYSITVDENGALLVDGRLGQDRYFIALGSDDSGDYFDAVSARLDTLSNGGMNILKGFHKVEARIAGFSWREADG